MTLLYLTAVLPHLLPLVAGADGTTLGVGGAAIAALVSLGAGLLKMLRNGDLVRKEELARETERADKAEDRAEKAEDKLQRMQDVMMGDLSPALLKSSIQGERLVESVTKITERVEKLVDAVLGRMERLIDVFLGRMEK